MEKQDLPDDHGTYHDPDLCNLWADSADGDEIFCHVMDDDLPNIVQDNNKETKEDSGKPGRWIVIWIPNKESPISKYY